MIEFVVHENEWYWGISCIIVTKDGKGVLKISFDETKTAVISNVSVYKDVRKQGYAKVLMDKAENIALSKGYKEIELICNKNSFVYYFYKRLGYIENETYFNDNNYNMVSMKKSLV